MGPCFRWPYFRLPLETSLCLFRLLILPPPPPSFDEWNSLKKIFAVNLNTKLVTNTKIIKNIGKRSKDGPYLGKPITLT